MSVRVREQDRERGRKRVSESECELYLNVKKNAPHDGFAPIPGVARHAGTY